MKIKQFIEHLKTYDQDTDVYCLTFRDEGGYSFYDPMDLERHLRMRDFSKRVNDKNKEKLLYIGEQIFRNEPRT